MTRDKDREPGPGGTGTDSRTTTPDAARGRRGHRTATEVDGLAVRSGPGAEETTRARRAGGLRRR